MTVKLSSALPDDTAVNGLHAIAGDLVADPTDTHLVIAEIDCAKTTVTHDDDTTVPTARIRRIEPIRPDDRDQARAMLRAAMRHRMEATFGPALNFDPDTGAILDDTGQVAP